MTQTTNDTFHPHALHVVAFAEAGATLQGELPLAQLPRLAAESHAEPQAGQLTEQPLVQWQAHGYVRKPTGGTTEIWLDLQAHVQLQLDCQRCLQGMLQDVSVQRTFRFVRDEATAQQLDDELEEDVLVYGKQFDLIALIEDELIMALPLAVRHDNCQPAVALQDDTPIQEQRPNPFAALQSLKDKKNG